MLIKSNKLNFQFEYDIHKNGWYIYTNSNYLLRNKIYVSSFLRLSTWICWIDELETIKLRTQMIINFPVLNHENIDR